MKRLSRMAAAVAACVCGASALWALPAAAQEPQRVEITGSAIRRLAVEGALPMTVISRSDIERSGVQSVTELIQALPAMQGFTTSSQSVNGGGAGTTTASLHGLGSGYTLVLLNGRRVAPFNTGSSVNLQSLPLAAIERVEVLSDGASALYGSDAIGGVVNFILRRGETAGEIGLSATHVERGGGEQRSASLTKGLGDLERDGFNLLGSLSIEKQDRPRAVDRPFSRSGIVRHLDGQNVGMQLISSNSVPGNVLLLSPDGQRVMRFYAPDLLRQGECPEHHVRLGTTCRFDFPSQVDLVPESSRATGLLAGRLKLGRDHEAFSELVVSQFWNKPTFAQPAQPGLLLTPQLYARHVVPLLGQLGLSEADIGTPGDADPGNDPTYNLRVFDAGGRRDRYSFDTVHWTLGGEGSLAGWDYRGHLTLSRQRFRDEAIGGYLSANRFSALIASGAFDPLAARAGEGVAALKPAVLTDELSRSHSHYHSIGLGANRPLFALGGGDVTLAMGTELARQGFRGEPSSILQGSGDTIIGANVGALPFDTTRDSYGLYTEVLWPLTRQLELTTSLRYDHYDSAVNRRAYDLAGQPLPGSRAEGRKADAGTWKVGLRFQPTRDWLVRASAGSGFKAPTLANITTPLQDGGVTSNSYDCPFTGNDPLAVGCEPPDSQYNILQGGNSASGATALKPERSKQFTVGLAFEPNDRLSLGLDYWVVRIEDQITVIPEAVAFADPVKYRLLFRLMPNPLNNRQQLRLVQQPVNAAMAVNAGVDLRAQWRMPTALGRLTGQLRGTYMSRADFAVPGQNGLQSSVGRFDVNSNVIFRWQVNGSLTLEHGAWTTTLTGHYRSGYQDHEARCADPSLSDADCTAAGLWTGPDIRAIDPTTGAFRGRVSYRRHVQSFATLDLQTRVQLSKAFSVTVGVRNLLGQDPPFSMQDSGGGNMRGYDGRYAEPLGRQWMLKANYGF